MEYEKKRNYYEAVTLTSLSSFEKPPVPANVVLLYPHKNTTKIKHTLIILIVRVVMGGGERTSMGALVPTVNAGETSTPAAVVVTEKVTAEEEEEEVDKDILCPICMQIIKDAFLTACGHSFCYMCIVTHLQNKSDCPCCSHYLTTNHLYPNFLLNKVKYFQLFS